MSTIREDENFRSTSQGLRLRRRRRGTIQDGLTDAQKEEARNAVLEAAEQRWKSAIHPPHRIITDTASTYSAEESSSKSMTLNLPGGGGGGGESASNKPSDRAVLRGWRRGRKEKNDQDDKTGAGRTRSTNSIASNRTAKSWRRKFGKPSSQQGVDAWMCGICGKAFTSFEAADVHEEAHIHQVVNQLPWMPRPQRLPSSALTGILRQPENNSNNNDDGPPTPVASNRQVRRHYSPEDHDAEEAKIPEDELYQAPVHANRRRSVSYSSNVPLRIDPLLGQPEPHEALLLSRTMQETAILADEAIVQVCEKAAPLVITETEQDAEWELACLTRDKEYYDHMADRERVRRTKPSDKYRSSDNEHWWGKVQNKFVDAYQLMKEGADKKGFKDEYALAQKENNQVAAIRHNSKTLYLNVMVKNNIQVVRKELERLAQQRWEREEMREGRFERFRALAHVNMVRLAGLALANDFTPRRVAVQLSNDLHRLLTPRLRRRGVTIETGIEYRTGPYFVIAINITHLSWERLIKATYKEVMQRKQKWHEREEEENHDHEGKEDKETDKLKERLQQWPVIRNCAECFAQMRRLTRYDVLAQLLAWCYHLHWVIYQPICVALYYTFLGHAIRQLILSSAADEIFYYIEQKGMEMEMEIRQASTQTAFMLSALREIRADGQALKKKRQQTESQEKGDILGPLLGPAIKADRESVEIPEGFETPDNLEYLGLELELPVGFRRLRWAFLHKDSSFITEAVYRTEAKYDTITMGEWNKHADQIGLPTPPPEVDESDFIGAEKEASYLMPRSAFVKANMCTETHYLIAYNDYCFCVRKKALTPEVPYGSTFVAWTQFLIINQGNESCKMYCSVEPEFPNGPPLVSRQIKSGMRAGVSELFVLIGETISKYADEYP